MTRVVACIIARTVSTRLPLKVLRDVTPGISMIEFLIQRLKTVRELDAIYLCTSVEQADDILEDVAARTGVKLYRGSPDKVIERMLDVGELEQADVVLRITGDNPLTSVEYIPHQLRFLEENNLDYVRVVDVPIGATAEVIALPALKHCYERMDPSVSEYLMLFLFEPDVYRCGIIYPFGTDYSSYSVTVDTPADMERTRLLLDYSGKQDVLSISLEEVMSVYTDQQYELPAKELKGGGTVKMPYDNIISFESFQQDMKRRKEGSLKLNIYE